MSSEQDHIRELARRIANQIDRGGSSHYTATRARDDDDDASAESLRAELSRLERRLARLESQHDPATTNGKTNSDGRSDYGLRERARALATPSRDDEHDDGSEVHTPRLLGGGGTYVSAVHPSQQRFGIDLAIAELVDHFESAKRCDMEPGDKPCDNCGMCSSRGF